MEIINSYPTSPGHHLLVAIGASLALALIIFFAISILFYPQDKDDEDAVSSVYAWALQIGWTVLFFCIPIFYLWSTEDNRVQDKFYENIPEECVQAATGPDAQRRVECTITINKQRDFVIIDGRFMPLKEAPDSDANHNASQ